MHVFGYFINILNLDFYFQFGILLCTLFVQPILPTTDPNQHYYPLNCNMFEKDGFGVSKNIFELEFECTNNGHLVCSYCIETKKKNFCRPQNIVCFNRFTERLQEESQQI